MIIWKGWGGLVIVFAVIFLIATGSVVRAMGFEADKWAMGVALILTGIPSWFVGKALNKKTDGKVFVDKDSGEEFKIGPQNTLFFIRMEYWGPILGVIGIITIIYYFI